LRHGDSRGVLLKMTGEQHIDYANMVQSALRGMVRAVLGEVAKAGRLPGQHHFYIAFSTEVPGVVISKRLKAKYPEEMTVVLQHRFWDLIVTEDRFEVNLSFDGIAERVIVPFTAIKVFFDPSVPYGLQFEEGGAEGDVTRQLGSARAQGVSGDTALIEKGKTGGASAPKALAGGQTEKKPRTRKPRADKDEGSDTARLQPKPRVVRAKNEQPDIPANDAKIVQLDRFRKK
jgi:hypothetical protein